jgi:hypothetical protein
VCDVIVARKQNDHGQLPTPLPLTAKAMSAAANTRAPFGIQYLNERVLPTRSRPGDDLGRR